ncbi:GntR family transcriptional regulator [Mycoplasmopsis lipofaciens]|uniref:GntR family transcriptional regulator n=1 Tax=Mycoplasmopsis lipofaciens TaxID=114884 RepID=UPI00055D3125|nr:GntR family transcriptional regulator [Mycoplasmopsis lipofaciens]
MGTKNKIQMIMEYLLNLIKTGKVKTNGIMPSEHRLMMRFDCSRSIVVAAYQKLEAFGITYSIAKKGHFAAENFHNLIKPLSFLLNCTKQEGIEDKKVKELPNWIQQKHLSLVKDFRKFNKNYYRNDEIIAKSEIYVSTKSINFDKKIDLSKSILNKLIKNKNLNNLVYSLEYEDVDNMFGYQKIVVITMFGYDNDSINIAGKYYIHPDYFKFFHQEFSLR